MKLLITNIQNFCLHDGPGIRTTVFLKGCNLHCPWCCNPENIESYPQFYYSVDKCISDGTKCELGLCKFADKVNSLEKLAQITEEDLERCSCKALSKYGEWYEEDDLFNELLKEKPFWGDEGGITFSGGEPLLQIDNMQGLLERLKKQGINLAVETALFVGQENVKRAIGYFDYFFVDMKILEKQICKDIIGGDIDLYLGNLEYLYRVGANVEIRVPMIKGYVDEIDNQKKISELLDKYNARCIRMPEHNLGNSKRKSLCQ